jgi:hypothetical protein
MRLFAERVMPVLQRDPLFAAAPAPAASAPGSATGSAGIFAPA